MAIALILSLFVKLPLESHAGISLTFLPSNKQKSYKCDNQLITWLLCITRPAGSCNLVTLKIKFAQYKNFVCLATVLLIALC